VTSARKHPARTATRPLDWMSPPRHYRFALAALLAVAFLVLSLGGAVASSTSFYNLAGHWTTPGTSLTLRQSGRTITWTGGPDNRAWIQTFKGTIGDDPTWGPIFSGAFRQDTPDHLPPRYHGTMRAQIEDSCHFKFLSIEQAGQPTLSNIRFTKVPCVVATKPLARLELILYKKRFVPLSSAASCPSPIECVVRNRATVRICNKDDFNHDPFVISSPNQFNAGRGKILLRRGQCFAKRFVNTGKEATQVKIYDRIHSQERFIVTVMP
jgi:hypothetical protein